MFADLTCSFPCPSLFRAVGWVDHSKTLREQGVDENETLLLRRKFFFSDQNIDGRDPVQLNLLYVQVRSGLCGFVVCGLWASIWCLCFCVT